MCGRVVVESGVIALRLSPSPLPGQVQLSLQAAFCTDTANEEGPPAAVVGDGEVSCGSFFCHTNGGSWSD